MTAQRAVLLDVLEHAGGHPDAESPFGLARRRDPGISLSTVDRALDLLTRHKLVDELRLGGSEHVHLICTACGGVQEADGALLQRLRGALKREQGFAATDVKLDVKGRCKRCAPAVRAPDAITPAGARRSGR